MTEGGRDKQRHRQSQFCTLTRFLPTVTTKVKSVSQDIERRNMYACMPRSLYRTGRCFRFCWCFRVRVCMCVRACVCVLVLVLRCGGEGNQTLCARLHAWLWCGSASVDASARACLNWVWSVPVCVCWRRWGVFEGQRMSIFERWNESNVRLRAYVYRP